MPMANVDAKYDEIEAARNAGKDTTDREEENRREALKIQKEACRCESFAINKASQIIADTAVSPL